jgi:hypothetical protein
MPFIADDFSADGPSLDQLVTEVVTSAQGFGVAPDKIRALDEDLTDSALTMKVSDARSPGVYEVEGELIYVTSVDSASGTCTIHPAGRGWLGSVAASHSAGALVSESPVFPRARVATAINDVITSLYPDIFGVGTLRVTAGTTWTIELPAAAETVLDVRRLDPTTSEWRRMRVWETEHSAADTVSGRSVLLPKADFQDDILVVYATRPQRLTTGDLLWSATGLDLGLKELVTLGALARLVRYLDLGRITDRFPGPQGDPQLPQPGSAFTMSRQLQAEFEQAKAREIRALRSRYPVRQHFTR